MKQKKTAVNTNQEDNFRMAPDIPEKVKNIFIRESRRKLQTLKQILAENAVQERKHEIFVISHGYKGNAGYLGLQSLADAAKATHSAINQPVGAEQLTESVKHLEIILRKSLQANEKGVSDVSAANQK